MYSSVQVAYNLLMTTVPLAEARSQFFEVVERAAAGERITLTNRGVPRAMLVPVTDDPRPMTFTREQVIDIFEHHQMPPEAWDAIRFPGDTVGEDGLG